MATQPTNDLLVWANTDVNLPNLAGPNKTQPSADLVAKGWDFKQKPSANEFNYILNNLSEWVEYLKILITETSFRTITATGFATGTATRIDGSDNINLELSMGSGFTNSKTTNGYTYLPNGLIFQWGEFNTGSIGNNVTGTTTLPLTFPNTNLITFLGSTGGKAAAAEQTLGFFVTYKTTSSFDWHSSWDSRDNTFGAVQFYAIGY